MRLAFGRIWRELHDEILHQNNAGQLHIHCYTLLCMAKELTAIRLRPEQVAGLKKIAAKDKETSISSLIRIAVDRFLEQEGVKKKK